MNFFEKHQWFFMLVAIVVGLSIGQIDTVANAASVFIMPFLIVMLFGVFLQVPHKNIKKYVRASYN